MEAKRKPEWLRINLSKGRGLDYVRSILTKISLNTVNEEVNSPNRMECLIKKTATFMIPGSQCSGNCRLCKVSYGELRKVDPKETENVANAAIEPGFSFVASGPFVRFL